MAQTFYISGVSLEPHKTAPQSGKTLTVLFRTFEDFSHVGFTTGLFTNEKADDVLTGLLNSRDAASVTPEMKKLLKEVAEDLIDTVGCGNTIHDWNDPSIAQRASEFDQRWRERIFGNTLRAYGITKRLTFDQALRVLQEHYIIEPVMES